MASNLLLQNSNQRETMVFPFQPTAFQWSFEGKNDENSGVHAQTERLRSARWAQLQLGMACHR